MEIDRDTIQPIIVLCIGGAQHTLIPFRVLGSWLSLAVRPACDRLKEATKGRCRQTDRNSLCERWEVRQTDDRGTDRLDDYIRKASCRKRI